MGGDVEYDLSKAKAVGRWFRITIIGADYHWVNAFRAVAGRPELIEEMSVGGRYDDRGDRVSDHIDIVPAVGADLRAVRAEVEACIAMATADADKQRAEWEARLRSADRESTNDRYFANEAERKRREDEFRNA